MHCGSRISLFANVSLVRNLDDRMLACRTNVFSRLEAVFGESLALGDAHPLDGWVFIEFGQVARDGTCGNFLAEESQTQGMHDAALIDPGNAVQTVQGEDIEVWDGLRIEGFIGHRQLNHEPAQGFGIFQFHGGQCADRLGGFKPERAQAQLLQYCRSCRRFRRCRC